VNRPRIYIAGNPDKPTAPEALEDLAAWLADRAEVVGAKLACDPQEIVAARPDRLIVLGGDGTMLGVARSLGSQQIPIIAVNLGKLGYLADFSLEDLKETFDRVVADAALISRRMILGVSLPGANGSELALNDCVIHAGPPFRVIRLAVRVDGEPLTTVSGDGLIVSTPGGSTAHNVSAGGPILQPGISAFVLTPLSPHSLTHRPLVVECDSTIEVTAVTANEGTVVSLDGQRTVPLRTDEVVIIQRSPTDLQLVRNPKHSRFHTLVTKLKWGQSPIDS
jgi:NAD+ kinase